MVKQYWADCATQNCVWLFQVKRKLYTEDGCSCEIYGDEGELLEGKTQEDVDNCRCYVETWETERVFLLREEAREWGKARLYAWGEENVGWRIYGVPSDGLMIELLGKHTDEFKDKVEYI